MSRAGTRPKSPWSACSAPYATTKAMSTTRSWGSGTSIIAAERQNRTCYAMEIDPAYVDAAVTRWEAYTGGAAAKDEKRGNDGG